MQVDCGEWRAQLLARLLASTGALRFGSFTLTSGRRSSIYLGARSLLSSPRSFSAALGLMAAVAAAEAPETECVIGVATAGIPWATGLSLLTGLPLGYVRPQAKAHGLGRIVEGAQPCRALLVDDVATTGGSLASAVRVLRSAGYTVEAALVLVDREQGASRRLSELGVRLARVAGLREILDSAHCLGLVDESLYRKALEELGETA